MRLLEAMYPSFVNVFTVGKSHQDRDIIGLRIAAPKTDDHGRRIHSSTSPRRKTIVLMGGMHAREWIATSSINYVAWTFITSYGKESMITKFLEKFDMVFIPTLNPDGFEHTWTADRLWRKTRQPTREKYCDGYDLDHSFGFHWASRSGGGGGAHSNPCSEDYGGSKAFEAVEAAQFADWARNETRHNHVQFVGLLDLHSYSEQVLYPYSFSCEREPPNVENLEELAIGLAKAIRLTNGEVYTVASACEGAAGYGPTGGSAVDWFYKELHAHYSFQFKLRDTGAYGFLAPAEYIVPTGEEMVSAVKYYCDFVLGNNGIEKNGLGQVQEEL